MNMMNITNEIKRVSWRVDADLGVNATSVLFSPNRFNQKPFNL